MTLLFTALVAVPMQPTYQEGVCEDPELIYFYTESPCRQAVYCEDPSRPDIISDVSPSGPVYAQWWCKIVNRVQYLCLWPAVLGAYLTYEKYAIMKESREDSYVRCDGFEDVCTIPMGWAGKMR
jgi:hypothetical protein